MGKFEQCLDVTNLETLLDILAQDSLNQALDVCPLVAEPLHLRETAVVDEIHKGPFPLGVGFGGDALCVDMMALAILRKREWVKVNLVVTSGQMGGQFP